jgi:hypothetical protein
MPPIRITPGGFVTTKPRHAIGLSGASSFVSNPFTIEGFQNLINYYGEIAWPIFNSAGDPIRITALHLLGNDTNNGVDAVDMARTQVMSRIVSLDTSDTTCEFLLNINGEFCWTYFFTSSLATSNVISEPFTTGGTITVASGSPTVVGAGTTWTTDVLTGGYGVTNPNVNQIVAGDILMVEVNPIRWIAFRIIKVTNDAHLDIYPTPSATNPALGVGLSYKIIRTGYNSYSRVTAFNVPEDSRATYYYYCGNDYHHNVGATVSYPHGTIECVGATIPLGSFKHYMSPKTCDSAGNPVAELIADDMTFFKGFIIYGAGPAISWSVAGAPSTLPFNDTDFPAKNITIVAPEDKFVSFELLGDQCMAFFENSVYFVVPTGGDPPFDFYKSPELMGILNPSYAEVSGMVPTSFNHGRPSASGRGAIYYVSNRGIEALSGATADEISAPISTALRALFGAKPLYVGWNCGDDTVLIRDAMFSETSVSLIFNPRRAEWSTLIFSPPAGALIAALTPGINQKVESQDHTRLHHYAYYETLKSGGTPATDGGNVRCVAALQDENTPTIGLQPLKWITPVLPVGLEYSDFSLGGFLVDAYSLNVAPVTLTWELWGGSSPYNLVQRQTDTMTFTGGMLSPWVSSRGRLSKKVDDPFIMLIFYSNYWMGISGVTLFESNSQVMR